VIFPDLFLLFTIILYSMVKNVSGILVKILIDIFLSIFYYINIFYKTILHKGNVQYVEKLDSHP